jgi:hypothetical protein
MVLGPAADAGAAIHPHAAPLPLRRRFSQVSIVSKLEKSS